MAQTIFTLLIAAASAVFGVLVIAGIYFAARAAIRDTNGIQREGRAPEPNRRRDRPGISRRGGRRSGRQDPILLRASMLLELQRTRSILLGWLSVLEAFALGDALRATALRAELGDINTCDVSLVGDANLITRYQVIVGVLRSQSGRGLPPAIATEVAAIRVRLLTALAEQERRLNLGEFPQIAEPVAHLDLWGPPRPITEVISRPAGATAPRPVPGDDVAARSAPASQPSPEPAESWVTMQPARRPAMVAPRIEVAPEVPPKVVPVVPPEVVAVAVPEEAAPRPKRTAVKPEPARPRKPAASARLEDRIIPLPPSPTSTRPLLRALPDPLSPKRAGVRANRAAEGPRPARPLKAAPAKPTPAGPVNGSISTAATPPKPAVRSAPKTSARP